MKKLLRIIFFVFLSGVNILLAQVPQAGFTASDIAICLGDTIIFTDTSSGSPTTWMWSFGDSNGSSQQNPTHIYSSSGTFDITLITTNMNGSDTLIKSGYITVYPGMTLSTNLTHNLCAGDVSGAIDLTVTGGTSPYSYNWNSGSSSEDITNVAAGNYSVIVTDSNGCADVQVVSITEPTEITAITTQVNPLCAGDANGSATINPSGGAGLYSYLWTPSGQTNATAFNLTPGSYSVGITDINGCSINELIAITEPVALQLNAASFDANCGNADGEGTVNVSGGVGSYTYQWDAGTGNQTTSTASNLSAGSYTVTVTDQNGCSDQALITIMDTPAPALSVSSVNSVLCNGDSSGSATAVVSGGTAPYSYQWNDPNSQLLGTATNLPAGSYTVTVVDSNGCMLMETVTITEPPPIAGAITWVDELCSQGDGLISATATGGVGGYSYSWSSGQTIAAINGVSSGSYDITITDMNGCILQENVIVNNELSMDSVWPGDTDNDGLANNFDLLAIGLGYGLVGPARAGASINWIGQPAACFGKNQGPGVNFRHADSDGNGQVNSIDTTAIIQNYNLTHNKFPLVSQGAAADPELYFDPVNDTVGLSEFLSIPVGLGTSTVSANDVYGLAFTIHYDPELVDSASIRMNFSVSWLGNQGSNLIDIDYNFFGSGMLEVAATRIDQNNITGWGTIGHLECITIDNLSGGVANAQGFILDTLPLDITDVRLISVDYEIPVSSRKDTIIIKDGNGNISGIPENGKILIYPNPLTVSWEHHLNVDMDKNVSASYLTITDILGNIIIEIMDPENTLIIDCSYLPSAPYTVTVKTSKGNLFKKLMILK